jgi:uncharacterized membrane protein
MGAEAKAVDRDPKPENQPAECATKHHASRETALAQVAEHSPSQPVTERIPENVAGMLCYLFGWAGGLVFLLLDRRPFVRFHAAQSIAVFAPLQILLLALSGFFLGALLPGSGVALLVLRRLLELAWLAAAVLLVLKAAGGEWFRVRFASQYGDRAAHATR